MALHEQSVGATDEWYTPKYVFDALGCVFDMDTSPGQAVTPWVPAKIFVTELSLIRPWQGFVWMNPPFGPRNGIVPWLERFFAHGNGICLTPDRTSAPWWQKYEFRTERSILRRVGPRKHARTRSGRRVTGARGTIVWPVQPPFGGIMEKLSYFICKLPDITTQLTSASYRSASSGLPGSVGVRKVVAPNLIRTLHHIRDLQNGVGARIEPQKRPSAAGS